MFRRYIVIASVAIAGCAAGTIHKDTAQTQQPEKVGGGILAAALLTGDEAEANRIAADILAGRVQLTEDEIRDDRPVFPGVILRTTYKGRSLQLGVSTVSDFAICLLQMRYRTSSSRVLRSLGVEVDCAGSDECDVCNSHAYPVDETAKRELQRYWSATIN